jgi:hypothetical protein
MDRLVTKQGFGRRIIMSLSKALSLLLFVSLCGAAQTQFPDTPAGRQFAAWMKAFNLGDREAYREFLKEIFLSRAEDLDQEWGFREQTGGFELKKIEESTATKVVALVQERGSDQFGRLALEVEAAEPRRITHMDVRAIPRPAEFPLPHMTDKELTTAVRKKLEHEAAADRFAGAMLLAKNGEPILAEAYGLANRERAIPNTLKTRFRIGSMNKMFYGDGHFAARAGGQTGTERSVTEIPDRLSQQGACGEGNDQSPLDARRRHRRHLRPGV